MTKPLVSLATLMLAEEGRLQLMDPVSRWLPEFAAQQVAVEEGGAVRLEPARREATVQDLLRHTAGFTYEFLGTNAVQRQYVETRIGSRARSNAEFSKALAAIPLALRQPGSAWEYSRATDVLGALLEVVAGRPLGQLLRQRILDPLGMKDTTFGVTEDRWDRIAEPFVVDPESGEKVRIARYAGSAAVRIGRRWPAVDGTRLRPVPAAHAQRRHAGRHPIGVAQDCRVDDIGPSRGHPDPG